MSCWTSIRFPKRFVTQELIDILYDDLESNTAIPSIDKFISENIESSISPVSSEMIQFEDDDNKKGEFVKTETFLINNKIPFDRYCAGDYEYDPETLIYRPYPEEIIQTVKQTLAGFEYIQADGMEKIYEEMNNLTKEELMKRITVLMSSETSYFIPPLENYIHETKHGANQTKMQKIDEVLKQIDEGHITSKEAFTLIQQIEEEHKDDKE